jgi:hypothetical protein
VDDTSSATLAALAEYQDKLHKSFLPLEAFDDPELEIHTPVEWLAIGAATDAGCLTGYTPYYLAEHAAYSWEPCEVRQWDAEAEAFTVVMAATGQTKQVGRLNLRLDAEDAGLFEARLRHAHDERDSAEASLRFHLYVDQMDDYESNVLPRAPDDFAYLLDEARALFDDSTLQAVRIELLEECRKDYYRGLKTAVLNYFLLSDTTWQRMAPLRLSRPASIRPPAPPLALAVTGARWQRFQNGDAFDELADWAAQRLFVALPPAASALVEASRAWQVTLLLRVSGLRS